MPTGSPLLLHSVLCHSHLFPVLCLLHASHQRQVEAHAEAVLEEERRAAAVQLALGDDGHAVTQEVSLVHVMGGQNHCPT